MGLRRSLLVAELMLGGYLGLTHGGAVIADGRAVPGDGLARQVMGLVASDASRCRWGIGWPNLARTAAPDVAGRLEHAGYLRRAGGWGPWRPGRWVPVNADWAFAPVARVRAALDATRPLSVPGRGWSMRAVWSSAPLSVVRWRTRASPISAQATRCAG